LPGPAGCWSIKLKG